MSRDSRVAHRLDARGRRHDSLEPPGGAGRALAFEQVARSWRTDEAFRQFWIDSLCGVSFGAYCWECPPVDDLRRNRGFECVFVSNPSLARMPPVARWPFMPSSPAAVDSLQNLSSSSGEGVLNVRLMRLRALG